MTDQVPQQRTPPVDSLSFSYDVFISYRHQERDAAWVCNMLLPRIEAEGLRACVDFRDFYPGRLVVKEMERAVVQSRYTLAVLSPAYLESNFTEFENIMATHLGLEQSQYRLLMVLIEPCSPPLNLRTRIWLSMTNKKEFEANISRLLQTLQQPLTAAAG